MILVGIMAIIIFYPPPVIIYPYLPFLGIFKRAVGIFLMSALLCLYRLAKGPTSVDRIVAMDILGILVVGLCAVLTIVTRRSWYIDIGIAWALQSFISTLAFSKFLEGKDFDE